jgi:hypothetical protein
MAGSNDSTEPGYLLPQTPLQPLADDAFDDFLHDVVAGITGFDPTLVRPRWEPEPAPRPDISVNWGAFGVTETITDFEPWVGHFPNSGNGYDALQAHELVTVLCSFYGPNAEQYCSFLQRGLYVDQNRAALRANGVGLVAVSGLTRAAEFVKERWWPRSDLDITLRREVRYNYNVLNLLRAMGPIIGQPPDDTRVIEDDYDTDRAAEVP